MISIFASALPGLGEKAVRTGVDGVVLCPSREKCVDTARVLLLMPSVETPNTNIHR